MSLIAGLKSAFGIVDTGVTRDSQSRDASTTLRLTRTHFPHKRVAIDPRHPNVLRVATLILAEIGPEASPALPQLHACLKATAIDARLQAAEAVLRIDPNDRLALTLPGPAALALA